MDFDMFFTVISFISYKKEREATADINHIASYIKSAARSKLQKFVTNLA